MFSRSLITNLYQGISAGAVGMGKLMAKPARRVVNAIAWLWKKFWTWEIVSWLVSVVCIGLAFVFAQYAWYATGRGSLIVGTLMLIYHTIAVARKDTAISAAEKVTIGVIVTVVLGGLCVMGLRFVDDIQWKNEVEVSLLFKSPNRLTERQRRQITLEFNAYYHYLVHLGFELPKDVPPVGFTSGGILSAGGSYNAPSYYSSLFMPDSDSSVMLRHTYSVYIFNRFLVDHTGVLSRTEVLNEEEAAWIYECYFPRSFDGLNRCGDGSPVYRWTKALWEVRSKYGAEYADHLLCYALLMWRGLPSKYVDTFDQWFRYKLVGGESVADNADIGTAAVGRHQEVDDILKKHGIDVRQP